jgi:hypothetical protein
MIRIKSFKMFESEHVDYKSQEAIFESLDLNKAQNLLGSLAAQFKFKMMVDRKYEYTEINKLIKQKGLKSLLAGSNGLIFNNGMSKKGDPDAWGNVNNPLKHSTLDFIIVAADNGMLKQFYKKVMDKIESIYDTNDKDSQWKLQAIRNDRKSGQNFRQLSTNIEGQEHFKRDKTAGSDQQERQRVKDLRTQQGGESYSLASVYFY